jgi:hypothetical protein
MYWAAPGVPGEPEPTARRPSRGPLWRLLVVTITAACCLVVAIVTGALAHARLTSRPTSAELSAAAATAVADRWRTWPAGRIFPAQLGYRNPSLLIQETASRVGISPTTGCRAGIDATLDRLASRYRCRGLVRATYVDELQGVVFTIGVLAFASARQAGGFVQALSGGGVSGVQAAAFGGTAGAAFTNAARQAFTSTHQGPYAVLTTSGYADGRPAAATGESNSAVFAPASQLAAEVIGPLTVPVQVNCDDRAEWSC